ncbi:MAG: ribonuclease R [Bdellovibrionales bacterium]|nr:ribonuclease R [Bdellovibrionales bacterium]
MSKYFKQKPGRALKTLSGYIKRHPDGFGFFIPDNLDEPDVYIPKKSMMDVMSNDRVEVEVFPEPGGHRFRGDVTKVLKRTITTCTGHYTQLKNGQGVLFDKSFAWGSDMRVTNTNNHAVKDGDWVSVQIKSYPGDAEGFVGDVVAVIEDIDNPLNDSLRVLASSGIPYEFSAKTLKEVSGWSEFVEEKDKQGRRDLTKTPLITIDGKTAKDFDDAIFVEQNHEGFHLIVAIADVSHYVKPGTSLDDDAYEKGTSTYFPNFVSPMLPEKLSNTLCSLKPNEDRLAVVADMKLDFQGELQDVEFYEAVICSHARVTYGQAQEVIDNEGEELNEFAHVKDVILRAADLAKILMVKRFKNGALNLEIPETEIELDETGEPVDIMQSERLFSHKLIEEMMLMANVAVAEHFTKKEIPAIYRIHDVPNEESLENLNAFLRTLGAQKNIGGGSLQKKITRALQEFQGHAKEHIINVLVLRSMSQAKYDSNNIGHFGLGFPDYTHFTSPIRRYPDLIVHRLLKASLNLGKGYRLMSEDELSSAGTLLSACEQRSVKAERQIVAIKKARFMRKFLGQEFEAIISSITKFGAFAILRQFDIDGLIRLEELGVGLEYDEANMRLFSGRTGLEYTVGDPVKIIVAEANIDDGRIDFVLASGGVKKQNATSTTNKPFKKRSSPENNRRGIRKARVSRSRRKGKTR